MNDKFENQKEKLISIKHEISLLYQQVNYLLRNEKPLELLDLDVLMNRTHTLYDQLCAINLGEEPDNDDLPFDADALSGIFGGMMQEDEASPEAAPAEESPTEAQEEITTEELFGMPQEETPIEVTEAPAEETIGEVEETVAEVPMEPFKETIEETTEEPAEETIEEIASEPVEETPTEERMEEVSTETVEETIEEVTTELTVETPTMETVEEVPTETVQETIEEVTEEYAEETPIEDFTQTVENKEVTPDEKPSELPLGDEYGFFFHFENVPEQEEKVEEQVEVEEPVAEMVEPAEDKGEVRFETVEKDGKVIHFMEEIPEEEIPERDLVHGDDLIKDNPLEMPKMEVETFVDQELEKERQTSETMIDFFSQDDTEFELSTPETLGEKMMQEGHSLADKLQQNHVRDLKSVIGINDKFLFVNELFGGSMEKYNKSIENLNDLKTLNGAMIYLNELKIELLWNSSNEAYQKLKDLVSRKFES